MKTYTQLTIYQRYKIGTCLNARYTRAAFALELNIARSTISRELERNGGHGHYSPIQANPCVDSVGFSGCRKYFFAAGEL